jgi:hypothetical protein
MPSVTVNPPATIRRVLLDSGLALPMR